MLSGVFYAGGNRLTPHIHGYAANVRGYKYIVFQTIIMYKSRLENGILITPYITAR